MNEYVVDSRPAELQTSAKLRQALPPLILLIVAAAAFLGYGVWRALQPAPPSDLNEYVSKEELEERYGLGVRLIGVTAGGGMVDFRLKILNPEKARESLQNPDNLPRLIAADTGEALTGTEGLDDDIDWEEGSILFILFSNTGGAIQPGSPVIVEFGEVQLEPIAAQ